ncbi:MAG: hypothetical protein AB4058_14200 [Microcystaceae cyanobacterium]
MVKQMSDRKPVSVKLEDHIVVKTRIPQEQHAALRAGFVGYPVNPRWNVDKYCAWKAGRQLRNDLQQGKLVIRPSDYCLICVTQTKNRSNPNPNHKRLDGLIRPIATWTQNILTTLPTS